MTEQSLRYTVVLGDWSDDGHGKMDRHQIEFFTESADVELTEQLIVANYQANVAKLGFGLPELWDDYEKSSPSEDQILKIRDELGAILYTDEDEEALEEAGLEHEFSSYAEVSGGPLPFEGFYTFRDYRGKLHLEAEEPLDLAMFIILSGLPSVGWRKLKEGTVLFGGYGTPLTGNRQVGYGLYY